MVQVAKSGLMAKYGKKLDAAVKAHKDDPIVTGQQNLPGGIANGIAQLIECKFDQYKEGSKMKKADGKSAVGEYYFYAAGTVMEPSANAEGIPVAGLRTSFTEPVCDTINGKGVVTTTDEHVANILNELKKLGADTDGADGSVLEAIAAERLESAPYFRFSTSVGQPTKEYPNPRVWENWYGTKGTEDYSPPDASSSIQDDTGSETTEASTDEETTEEVVGDVPFGDDLDDLAVDCGSDDNDTASTATAKMAEYAAAVGVDHESSDYEDWAAVAEAIREARGASGEAGDDVTALAEAAEGGDQEAADKLDELRQAVGISDEDYGTLSWTELGEAITAAGEGNADEAPTFSKGDVCQYLTMNPKTKKKDKAIDCEILSVVDDKVTLKDLTTNKPIMDLKTKKAQLFPTSELVAS